MNNYELFFCSESKYYKFNDGSILNGFTFNNHPIKKSYNNLTFSFAKPFKNGFALVEHETECPFQREDGDIDFLSNDGSFFIELYINSINPYEELEDRLDFNCKNYRLVQDFLKLNYVSDKSWKDVLDSLGSENHSYHRYCKTGDYFLVHLSLIKILEKYLTWNDFINEFHDLIQFKIPTSWNPEDYNFIFSDVSLFFYLDFSSNKIIAHGPYADAGLFSFGVAPIREFNKDYGFISKLLNDDYKIHPQYELAFSFKNNLARVMKNGKFGYVDIDGNTIIDFKFDDARSFNNGWAAVANFVSEKIYTLKDVNNFYSNKYENKDNGLRWHFIDINGNITKSYIYGFPFSKLGDIEQDGTFTFKLITEKKNSTTSLLRLGKFEDAIIRNELLRNGFKSDENNLQKANVFFRMITIDRAEKNQNDVSENMKYYFVKKEKFIGIGLDDVQVNIKLDSFEYYSNEFDPSISDKYDDFYLYFEEEEDMKNHSWVDYNELNKSGLDMLNEDSDGQWNEDSY